MKEFILHLVVHYSYFGLFISMAFGIIGLPIPDETILAFAGFLAFNNELHFIPALLSAFAGSVSGITVSFFLGRTLGIKLLNKARRFIHNYEETIKKTHNNLEKYGGWIFIFGYYIPGIRHLVAIIAGTTEVRYSKFALYAYTGAFIWSTTFITLGYFLGKEWMKVVDKIHGPVMLVSIILIALVLIIYILKRFFFRKHTAS